MKFFKNIKNKIEPTNKGRAVSIALIVVGVFLIGFASFRLISTHVEYAAARSEYDELRELFRAVPVPIRPAPVQTPTAPVSDVIGSDLDDEAPEHLPPAPRDPIAQEDLMQTLFEMNSDFIGWIYIDNLISYPMVQGQNNSRYLNTTFQGRHNASGAIFMDYRNNADLSSPVTIIYGHNMRDGSMFEPLHRLRNHQTLQEHQFITITTPDWTVYTYRIFAARIVSAWDVENNPRNLNASSIGEMFRGAPDAERYLILSTCTFSSDDDERLRVYAALIDYTPSIIKPEIE